MVNKLVSKDEILHEHDYLVSNLMQMKDGFSFDKIKNLESHRIILESDYEDSLLAVDKEKIQTRDDGIKTISSLLECVGNYPDKNAWYESNKVAIDKYENILKPFDIDVNEEDIINAKNELKEFEEEYKDKM